MCSMGPEDEFEFYNKQNSWAVLFEDLQNALMQKHEASAKDARRPKFRSRNRYADVSPYDHSRVRLQRNNIDYINASLVEVSDADRAYILTQGPLRDTCGHFWLMIWEQNTRAVIMLNRVIEKSQVKCHQYYPVGSDNEGDNEMVFNDVGLKVAYVSERHSSYHFTTRVLQLTDLASEESREVLHFHYTAWPDFGVPESPTAFLDFLFTIRAENVLDDPDAPCVIHCSAGIGRSGTICLVDSCLVLAGKDSGKLDNVNVPDVLTEMRQYRMGLIQTPDQLRFSYQALIEGARRLFHTSTDEAETADEADMNRNDSSAELTSNKDINDTLNEFSQMLSEYSNENSLTDHLAATSSSAQAKLESLFVPPPPPPTSQVKPLVQGSSSSPRSDMSADKDTEHREHEKELRRRVREERNRNTTEQIARIKQRQRETEREKEMWNKLQPYVITAASVAVVVVGYLIYQHLT